MSSPIKQAAERAVMRAIRTFCVNCKFLILSSSCATDEGITVTSSVSTDVVGAVGSVVSVGVGTRVVNENAGAV